VAHLNFCTLFDSNYLSRGLALYESLKSCCKDFHLYIFAFDDESKVFLESQQFESVTVIGLDEFEDDDLSKVRPSRTKAEFCWTCTPSTLLYALDKFNLSHCTYLDADVFFFSSPEFVIEEFLKSQDSVLITPHHYTPLYARRALSGTYCVQFIPVKNDKNGRSIIQWWRDRCLEWCFARMEEGKFGDQKYLDDWPQRFEGVKVSEKLGLGLAPWNVQQVKLKRTKGLSLAYKGNTEPVIFYHFHQYRMFKEHTPTFGNYYLDSDVIAYIYKPYSEAQKKVTDKYELQEQSFNAFAYGQYSRPTVRQSLRMFLDEYIIKCEKIALYLKSSLR
jgi:hypothetical protein